MPQDEAVPVTPYISLLADVDRIIAAHRTAYVDPPTEIRLTADQLERVRQEIPTVDFDLVPGVRMFGVPIVLVDDVEDSTPWQRGVERQVGMHRKAGRE